MSAQRFTYGDEVRHERRPEWGVGAVVKAVDLPEGHQRLSVRFSGAGVKTLNTEHAPLVRAQSAAVEATAGDGEPSVANWHDLSESEWMGSVAQKKVAEAMRRLPEPTVDPFRSIEDRLEATMALFRFEPTGRGLVDWAVAQTGLDDPLSRFNRHELESFFERWCGERNAHLGRLLAEAPPGAADRLLAKVSPAARRAVKRLGAVR